MGGDSPSSRICIQSFEGGLQFITHITRCVVGFSTCFEPHVFKNMEVVFDPNRRSTLHAHNEGNICGTIMFAKMQRKRP